MNSMILLWRPDTNPGGWTDAQATNYLELGELGLDLYACQPVPPSLPALTIYIKSRKPADFFWAGLVRIVSAELREVLESFPVKAEFLPVNASHAGRRYTKKTFYFVNILDVVECFDFERSRYKQTRKGVHEIEEAVLDESK